jgi:hypothetical protein
MIRMPPVFSNLAGIAAVLGVVPCLLAPVAARAESAPEPSTDGPTVPETAAQPLAQGEGQTPALPLEAAQDVGPAADPAPATPDSGGETDADGDGEGDGEPEWRGSLELYGFAPLKATGTTRIRGFEADVDLNLGDILDALEWATFVRGYVERDRWGLLTDLSYVQLGAQAARTGPRGRFTGKAEVTQGLGIYDLAVRYRIGAPETALAEPGTFTLVPYAGVRLIDASLDVDAQVRGTGPLGLEFERQGTFGRTWAQPLVGLQGQVFLSPRLRAFARADIGGFGISGDQDLSGNAQVGLGYAIGNSTQVNLSWRYLGLEYRNDNSPSSGFSLDQNGIEVGLTFFF